MRDFALEVHRQSRGEAFTTRMVEECGVPLLPSSVFRTDLTPVPNDCVRVGFGRSHIPRGVTVRREWLNKRSA